jgi:hypothetical protein
MRELTHEVVRESMYIFKVSGAGVRYIYAFFNTAALSEPRRFRVSGLGTWQAYPPFRESRHPSCPPPPLPPPFYLAPSSKIAGRSMLCRPSCSQHRGERGLVARDFQVSPAFKGKGGLSDFMHQR